MRKKGITPAGLTPKQERARKLLAVLDADPSKTGRTPDKLKAARAAVTKLAHLAKTPRTENNAETFAAACAAVNTSGDRKAQELAKRRVNDVLRAFGKLPQTVLPYQEYVASKLREMFSLPDVVSSEKAAKVSDALHTLAQLLRVELPDTPDELPGFYLRAIRELEGDVRADEALRTAFNVPHNWDQEQAAGERGESTPGATPRGKTAARKPAADEQDGERVTIWIKQEYGIGSCGFVYGEVVEAVRADDLRPGEIAAYKRRDGTSGVARVASIGDSLMTILCDGGDAEQCSRQHTFLISELEFLGRVNPEPVGRWNGPTEEERKRIKEARRRLKELGDEDDQIIRCTERYRLEKEIFDILHPAGGDPEDWSAWEEEDEE